MNKFKITLIVDGYLIHEIKEDEKSLIKINACLSLNRCVILGDTVYTRENIMKITEI